MPREQTTDISFRLAVEMRTLHKSAVWVPLTLGAVQHLWMSKSVTPKTPQNGCTFRSRHGPAETPVSQKRNDDGESPVLKIALYEGNFDRALCPGCASCWGSMQQVSSKDVSSDLCNTLTLTYEVRKWSCKLSTVWTHGTTDFMYLI